MRHPTAGSSTLKHERFTYADYKTWPEGERWELIGGQAFDMCPAPRRIHQTIAVRLIAQMDTFFQGKPCQPYIAPIDVFWTDDLAAELDALEEITQPDLLVACDPRQFIDEGIKGAPAFIIEILSPSTAFKDQTDKLRLHERFGVAEYWLVNPSTLEVFIYRLDPATPAASGQPGYGTARTASLRDAVPVTQFPGLSLRIESLD
jgi:Uma2 family endonuclease